ncbi:MAG: Arc family DNA-binding protein, partial [Pseudomonadales bacterium]|nr:Arc family DNA-binding protein [Pseudomonadales bacterium]
MNTEVKVPGSRTADKFVVRLPDGMRQKIADVAKNYHR